MQKKILSVLVENHSGVLWRVVALLSRRGYNIDCLAVGETEDSAYSRMTIILACDDRTLEQVEHQLRKMMVVKDIKVLENDNSVSREMILVKVHADGKSRREVIEIADVFRARIIDFSMGELILELTGETNKTQAFIDLLKNFGIIEVARTGTVALSRGIK